jgi:hypothetical protein
VKRRITRWPRLQIELSTRASAGFYDLDRHSLSLRSRAAVPGAKLPPIKPRLPVESSTQMSSEMVLS